jgi:hypothetical protein
MPIRDDSAGNYGQWDSSDLSWLDFIKATGSDVGNGAYNALSNITGALSPIGTSPEGNMSLQVPPMITGIADSYRRLSDPTGPGNAYRLTGVPELDAPIQQDMSNVLLSLYGGNALNPLARAPQGSVGMFAGRKAATADHAALAKAEGLAASGASRDQIWNETGWFQGPDQQWRFEIDDSKSWLGDWGFSSAQKAGNVMKHKGMFDAYPDLMDIPMRGETTFDSSYNAATDSITVGMHQRNGALHEMQHAIQKREGFDKGGNVYSAAANHPSVLALDDQINALEARASDPSATLDDLRALDAEIRGLWAKKKATKSDVGFEAYLQIPGEVEARLVESRMNMTPEQRMANPPWANAVLSDTGRPSIFGSALATAGEQHVAAANSAAHAPGLPPFERPPMPEVNNGLVFNIDRNGPAPVVTVKDGDRIVGSSYFDELPDAIMNREIYVDSDYRRQGLASRMYGYMQDQTGKPLTPDKTMTPDGYEFWKSSYPEAVKRHEYNGEWVDKSGVDLSKGVPEWRMSGGPNRDSNVLWSDTGKPSIFGSALATAGEQRQPIKAFHSTDADFDTFNSDYTNEVGFHFGDKATANNRAYIRANANPFKYFQYRNIPVEIDAKKVAELSSDVAPGFQGAPLARQLVKDGIAPPTVLDDASNESVRAWLVDNGYDLVSYPNKFEGGGAPSYMALGTGNVRHATTGKTLYSDTGRPSIFGSALATAGEQPRGMTLYHGSPHDFDKFSLDKIGTGEGNQAFGRGVYLASNEDVAKYYRDTLAPDGGGHMYKVDINAPDEAFMDMSKGLSEQSDHVRNALLSDRVTDQIRKQYGVEEYDGRYLVRTPSGSMSAKTLEEAQRYADDLAKTARADKSYADFNAPYLIGTRTADFPELADALRESGIAGAKYFDQHSRLADEGNQTMNYVVYDDSLIDILKKYGIAGGAVGAGAMAQPDSASAGDLPDWLKF